jgi:hypothetical protein
MPRLQHHSELVHVAFDSSKNTLVAGVLRPGEETPTIEGVANDESPVPRFVKGFPDPGLVRTCYEAGARAATSCTASWPRWGSPAKSSPPRWSRSPRGTG